MFRRSYRQFAVLLFISFVLGLVDCAFASSSKDPHRNCDAQSDCPAAVSCGCHCPALAVCVGNGIPLSFGSQQVVEFSPPLKLPLFAASIFNPPKA